MAVNVNYVPFDTLPKWINEQIQETKSKKFRVGFIKKNGELRVGTFDTKHRVRWKLTDGTMYTRKGEKRTTKPEDYLLAHDLIKKAPRNINYRTIQWFAVNKKLFIFNDLLDNENFKIRTMTKVPFSYLKKIMTQIRLNNEK